jgi:hypothetical protein
MKNVCSGLWVGEELGFEGMDIVRFLEYYFVQINISKPWS